MTTTPMDATAAAANPWPLRHTTPDGDEMPGDDRQAGDSELSFGDLLDVVNPLQHLPIVGTIYRALTGDTISETARIAGGALYGGPFGFLGAVANMVVERETGKDIGDTALAWASDELGTSGGDAGTTALADASAGRPATAAAPINAAPVTTAAAYASAAGQQAAAQASSQAAAAQVQQAAAQQAAPQRAAPQQSESGKTPFQPVPIVAADASAKAPMPSGPSGTTNFTGRSADRLDAFIRAAEARRRGNPMGLDTGRGGTQTASTTTLQRLQHPILGASPPPAATQTAAANQSVDAKAADVVTAATRATDAQTAAIRAAAAQAAAARSGKVSSEEPVALAGQDTGSVNQWMLRALDKYEQMKKHESS